MDWQQVTLFLIAATALLGSPGPAIAALLAVGRVAGWSGGFTFYLGLQLGLGSAALITASGLFSLMRTVPGLIYTMSLVATAYLIYLAWKIASAQTGSDSSKSIAASWPSGFAVGVTNPKAYLAFASLFASFSIHEHTNADISLKVTGVVCVMIVVDLVWLYVGVALQRLALSPRAERIFNILLGAMVFLAAGLAILD